MSATAPSFYVTGGTLRHDAASYVVRQADTDLYEGMTRGEFCYVLTPRQMGKSSLMVHTAARLRRAGVAVAVLDFTAIGQDLSAEQWYGGLLDALAQQLDLDDELEAFWLEQTRFGPLQRWIKALEAVVLARVPGRIVLFVDEIDAVRSLPFSTDEFFAGIRGCYNRRTGDPEFTRLTFCLLGVATPWPRIPPSPTQPARIASAMLSSSPAWQENRTTTSCSSGSGSSGAKPSGRRSWSCMRRSEGACRSPSMRPTR